MTGNAAGELSAGMIVSVRLMHARLENSIVIPRVAIMPTKGEHVVFVAEEDRAVRRTVRLGDIIGGTSQHVVSGLSPGDRVVIEGQRTLEDGVLVNNVSD